MVEREDTYTTESPVTTGVCYGCDTTNAELYRTPHGLRCDDCVPDTIDSPAPGDTYGPSLSYDPDPPVPDRVENIETFKENLPEIEIEVDLEDGSTHTFSQFRSVAILHKYGEDWQEFVDAFPEQVAEYYRQEREPIQRRKGTVSWGGSSHDDSKESYETHAELAPVVAYPQLRAAIMSLCLVAQSDDNEEAVNVVGLRNDGAVDLYSDAGRITVEEVPTGDTHE